MRSFFLDPSCSRRYRSGSEHQSLWLSGRDRPQLEMFFLVYSSDGIASLSPPPPHSSAHLDSCHSSVECVQCHLAPHLMSCQQGCQTGKMKGHKLRETWLVFLPQSEGSHDDHSLSSYKGRETTCYCPVVSWCLERFSPFLVLPSVLE